MPPQFGNAMQAEYSEVANSSEELSSPPASPPHNQNGSSFQDTIHVAPRASLGAHSGNTVAHATNGNTASDANTEGPGKKLKRQRKPREPKPEGETPPKVRKPRKPREPKVKPEDGAPATATNNTTTTPASRKRQPKEEAAPAPTPPPDTSTGLRQSTIQFQPPNPPPSTEPPSQPHVMPSRPPLMSSDSMSRSSLPPPNVTGPSPRPLSSGQNYDPIRGATITSNLSHSAQASPRINRASASPSITSLIDPPLSTKPPVPSSTFISQPLIQPSPSAPPAMAIASPPLQAPQPIAPPVAEPMDVDSVVEAPKTNPPPEIKLQSKSSSSGPTPKPTRPASPPAAPKGTGSGLLSTSDLFGGPSMNSDSDRKGIDIELQIPLKRAGGNTNNIAQEVAKRYGRDAINPRAAEHRARLLAVAAAANKIDGGSGADDMSVDLTSELDGDSNVEMGGMGDDVKSIGADNTDGGKPTRKRRKKVEDYDKDDDFIDDTELAWQEQAAVAKDGFFVYSGPLIPEGQSAQVESTSAPTRGTRGGRGRGRGRAAAAAANNSTHASTLADKTKDAAASTAASTTASPGTAPTSGRGSRGGRGRGTGAPRKPRVTKADRERMEAEKAQRERQAAESAAASATGAGAGSNGTALPLSHATTTTSSSTGSVPTPLTLAPSTGPATNAPHAPSQGLSMNNGLMSATSTSLGAGGATPLSVPTPQHLPLQIQPQTAGTTPSTLYGARAQI